MLAAILAIVGTLVPAILTNRGVIGQQTDSLINSLLSPVENLIADLKSGNTKTQNALAALAMASGVIITLKGTTGLPAELLTQLNNVDVDIQAALAAYAKAGTGLDLTVYIPPTEV